MASRPEVTPTRDEQCKLLLAKAEKLENGEKFGEALESIQEIIKLNPSHSTQVYSTKGKLLYKLGKLKDSIVAYCTALNLDHTKNEREDIAIGLKRPLDKYVALNWQEISETIELLKVRSCNSGGKKLSLSERLSVVGNRLLETQLLLQDAKIVLEAVPKFPSVDESFLHNAYIDLGVVYHTLDEDKEKCLHCFKEALSYAQLSFERLLACEWIGIKCCELGRYEEGQRYLNKALKNVKSLPLSQRETHEIRILSKRVCGLELEGKLKDAIEQYKELLERPVMAEMAEIEIEIRINLGRAYQTECDWRKACEEHRKALDLSRRCQLRSFEESALANLTEDLMKLGNYKEALKIAKKHLKFCVETQNRMGEVSACSALGNIYESFGDYKNALIYHKRDLAISRELGDLKWAGKTLTNLGVAYRSVGNYKEALNCFKERLEVAQVFADEEGKMKAHKNIGDTYEELGDYSKASSEYDLYAALALKQNDPERKAKLYLFRGQRLLKHDVGDHVEVIRLYQKALRIAQSMGLKELQSLILANMGHVYLNCMKRNIPESTSCFQQGRSLSREQGDAPMQAQQTYGLACASLASGGLVEAEGALKDCVDLYENIQKKMRGEESLKIPIQDVQKQVYKRLEFVQVTLKKHKDALLTAERGRARAIADVMQLNSSSGRSPTTVEDIRSCADNSSVLFYSLNRGLVFIWIIHCDGGISFRLYPLSLQSKVRTSLQNQIEQLCEEMSREIRVSSTLMKANSPSEPSSPALQASDTFDPVQQQTLHSEEAPSMEDASLARSDPVVSPNGADYLVEQISRMYRAIDKSLCTRDLPHRNTTPPNQSGGDNLYNALIGSVQDLLVGSPEIVIVPEGPLYKLPFSALKDQDGHYLSESARIRVVPSLTTLQIIAKRRVNVKCKEVLIAGDPNVGNVQVDDGKTCLVTRLPAANRECEMIGQMLHVTPLTGNEATKTAVLQRLGHAHLIHLAAHGRPETGEILLAPKTHSAASQLHDVMLQMSEVQAVKLRAQLVVLSCCDSGRGEIRTEGVIGIARSFLAAGARAVLVSLWSIDDEGTYHFMRSFYRHLISGMTAGEAQHQAMEDMRKSKEFHKEKYWAPFILLGDDVRLDFDPYNS